MLKKCKQCGKTFKTKLYYIKKGYGNYCSRACFNIGRRKKVKRICEYCKKEFYALPCIIKKGFALYCSSSCHYRARDEFEQYRGKHSPKYNRIERICKQCGNPFLKVPSKIKIGHGLYCSKRCYAEYKKKTDTYSGKNSVFWKGGYYPYYGVDWPRINRKTIKKSENISELSKNNGGKLAVHHIIPMRNFINKYLELCLKPYIPEITYTSFKTLPFTLIPDVIYQEANQSDNLIALTLKEHSKYEKMPLGFFDAIKRNKKQD